MSLWADKGIDLVAAPRGRFLDELDFLPAATAIQKTAKMAKALSKREKQNRANGPPIPPEVFSAHVANIAPRINNGEVSPDSSYPTGRSEMTLKRPSCLAQTARQLG